ncbi:TPA: imidazole glycerol phosphate synthase subunit HisH [Legionella pneumophila]|uniref:Imidazole glycerol phosphate synthase subunit HisH n=1 Tax=Legionella pneumophila TaxID=446 RepID=A0AAN5R5A9_LEGPN|nr:imidazole glycerol phosphate synthase subunit HisH [Legionella pneumophila]HAT1972042.1 imidazole glycerol phosphate synthase subunit HisH [Legionella pneumophila]HAT6957329.1 imidazole glycerol phosphate synthase subunit HisH [Legionella pneumophila]HBC0463965.1 imidazole glycerol phosphate synthase subunit HisH [Legionella pneumophila]HEN4771391.1 imidazole glycerol phosphate synthase subunit HisH [Legionella pneumophila]
MIAVIDVSGNNLTSLTNALIRLGCHFALTHDAEEIQKASHVILPGVGTARSGMKALQQNGLIDVLRTLTQPLLGICLGMQLLLEFSEEDDIACLGLIPGVAELLKAESHHPVPHMGWNNLHWQKTSSLQQGLNDSDYVYFVHSYALKTDDYALARCQYHEEFTAVVKKDNFYGMQFHPEKSADVGLLLLNNFLSLESAC